ncbi:Chymotrypsin-2 [Camponotus japonicus]
MIEMRPGCLKCSLTVALVVCTYIVGSGANGGSSGAFASASAYAGAGGFALSNVGAGAGDFSGVHDGHKGIRSYDSSGFSHDNDADRGAKSYGAVPGHGAGGDGIKGSDHGYNKNDCSKCKWENDDYWERDEPEEEGDENDGDECDDGQYKPDGTRHRGAGGSGKGHRPGSHPSGVHKTGPTGVYVDAEGGRPAGPFSGAGYPVPTTGYAAPTGGFGIGSTPKPGSGWNTPFSYTTLKPGYAGATAGAPAYGTPSSSRPDWNRGITPSSFATTSKPTWGSSSGPAGHFVTTPKPGTNWDTGSGAPTSGQPSWQPWNTGHDGTPVASTSRPGQGWNTGFDNTPTTDFSQKPAPGWNAGRQPTGSFGVTPKSEPNWNTGPDNTPAGGLPFPRKPGSWSGTPRHDGAHFSTTPKPGQSWNVPSGGQPSWNTGHDGTPVASTSRPGQGWNTGFDNTPTTDFSQKPAPGWNAGRQSTGSFGVTPKPEPNWNTGPDNTPAGGLPFPRKPGSWSGTPGHGANFGTTPKPGQSWNAPSGGKPEPSWNPDYGTPAGTSGCPRPDSSCTQGKQGPVKLGATPINIDRTSDESPSGISSAGPQTGSGLSPPNSYGSPKENQNWPYGQSGIQSTGAYAGASVTSGVGNIPHGGAPNFGKKDHPFVNKPMNTQTPYSGVDQAHPNISGGTYSPGSVPDYNKPGQESTWPSNVANTFGTTKRPFGGINSPGPGIQGNIFNSGKLPGSPTESGVYPSITKPNYGSGISPGQPASGSNTWYNSGTTISHTRFPAPTGFGTTKIPFGHTNIPGPSNSYSGTGLKQPSFNAAGSSASASAGASAFGPFPSTYTPYITPTTPTYEGASDHPGVKSSSRPAYGVIPHTHPDAGTGAWPGKQPGSEITPGRQPGSGTTLGGYPGSVSDTSPGKQPGDNSGSWPSKKPGDVGSNIWPGQQPGSVSPTWPARQPGSGTGNWPSGKPGDGSSATPGNYPGFGSGIGPIKQPPDESGAWPSNQPDGSRTRPSECSNVNCGNAISSNCGGENYNCGSSCTGRDNNTPATHRPCSEPISGPSGVNKTYYPAGTGDGHVPNIGNIYGSASPFNNGAYPQNVGCRSGDNSCNQGASVTPEDPVRWNSVNPFLFGGSSNSETTIKPIGKGNPFLNSGWNEPKPEYSSSNANNDRNVIPYDEENTKPFGRDNPFLNDNRRGDTKVNPNESVIPLGGRKPEKYNPFFGSANSGSGSPSYTDGQPDGYPASRKPESDGVKGGSRGVSPQQENSGGVYPTDGNPGGVDPLRCKLGIFGCGTPGSGSYETKHPRRVLGGIGGGGNSGNVGNVPGGPGDPGTGVNRGQFDAGHSASAGSNLPGFSGAYAGSIAQASSLANAKSLPFPGTAGSGNDFGQARSGNWPSSGAQNQGGSNSWASSSAFANSNSGSWSGHYPTDVKG